MEEHHVLAVTKLLNWLLGKPVAALLAALHIQPENPQYPIPNHVAMEIVVFVVAAVFFLWLKRRISVDRPGGTQQCIELLLTNPMNLGVRDLLASNLEHGAEKYVPMLGSIGIFVLMCNLISLVPGLESPTATVSVPFGCAVVVFGYYNWSGIRHHGVLGYGKHFLGPNLYMSPLMVVIEAVSHSARLLSLTVRLWVNMFVSELLYGIFLGLLLQLSIYLGHLNVLGYVAFVLPLAFPLIFIVLHIFVGILQAFVFTVLPVIYVAGAVKEAH
ncbi:MAG: F0F1 ATP synthase subunit A [Acidobacteria bacterium]|nr:F0F1 ATP synthase subunit A [Acidobacteriota bacterium]MCL5286804.1 F0F1 ATP synthase subunit A [Acidobacteriota bacterium]